MRLVGKEKFEGYVLGLGRVLDNVLWFIGVRHDGTEFVEFVSWQERSRGQSADTGDCRLIKSLCSRCFSLFCHASCATDLTSSDTPTPCGDLCNWAVGALVGVSTAVSTCAPVELKRLRIRARFRARRLRPGSNWCQCLYLRVKIQDIPHLLCRTHSCRTIMMHGFCRISTAFKSESLELLMEGLAVWRALTAFRSSARRPHSPCTDAPTPGSSSTPPVYHLSSRY